MKRNLIETLMGAVVLVVAGVFVVLAYGAADVGSGGGYQLRADFNRATGIAVGTDVRMSGIKIGQVADMSLDPQTYLATVTLTIDDTIRVEVCYGRGGVPVAPGNLETCISRCERST